MDINHMSDKQPLDMDSINNMADLLIEQVRIDSEYHMAQTVEKFKQISENDTEQKKEVFECMMSIGITLSNIDDGTMKKGVIDRVVRELTKE